MKYLTKLILFLFVSSVFSQTNPFDKLNFDKVVAYEFQGNGELLIERCLKEKKDKINKTLELSKKQVNNLEQVLTSKESYGNSTFSCFDPHFAVVYYKNNKIIGSINICLECNYLISSEKIPATELKWIKISDDYSYPAKGFSKITRKEIYNFCKNIGFDKYLKPLNSYLDD
ncbi:hypothetical protein [Hwangdonia lutea]|uniref:Uncharacterized protein n=1 Tax=Hwangdonia lutea TaxID=3075823 RepID=A0AA97EK40_9FLAO|nr:hypothetical protein [Hwangdonia sp. SCSIO 19198]WOD42911.1 hypothetical protein RNZ46_13025 [Hwangdonia sp. SCSIO 19198]